MCTALLKAGANPNVKDATGKKPLDYFRDKRKREKFSECLTATYKEGVTPERLHQDRQDQSGDKSLNKVMNLINQTAVNDVNSLIRGVDGGDLNAPSVFEPPTAAPEPQTESVASAPATTTTA